MKSNNKKTKIFILTLGLIFIPIFFLSPTSLAKDYYRVDDYETELVDECGDCTYVENNNCLEDAIFAPTKTCSEWNKFRSYHPYCVDLEESHHEYRSCYSNDSYWYNACGAREDRYQDCGSNYCDTGGDVKKYCFGGDVWGVYDYANKGCSGGSCYFNWNHNSCGHKKLKNCSGSTSCGYGKCNDGEKPSWGCSGGNCKYSCVQDSSCETLVCGYYPVPYGTWNAPFFDVEILSPGHVVECNTYNNCWHVDYSAFFHQHLYDTPFEWIMINREYPSHWSYNQVYNHLKNKILTSDDGYRVKIGKLKEHFYYSDPGYHAWHHELCYIK